MDENEWSFGMSILASRYLKWIVYSQRFPAKIFLVPLAWLPHRDPPARALKTSSRRLPTQPLRASATAKTGAFQNATWERGNAKYPPAGSPPARFFDAARLGEYQYERHGPYPAFVEFEQTLRCGQALADKHGVEAFQIGEDDELLQRGVVAEVACGIGMRIAPLLRGLAEEGDVCSRWEG